MLNYHNLQNDQDRQTTECYKDNTPHIYTLSHFYWLIYDNLLTTSYNVANANILEIVFMVKEIQKKFELKTFHKMLVNWNWSNN